MNKQEAKYIDAAEPNWDLGSLLLIDADILYHRSAYSVEQTFVFGAEGADPQRFTDDADVIYLFNNLLRGILKNLQSNRFILCWSLLGNFRRTVDPTYKANRQGVRRPTCSAAVKERLMHRYPSIAVDGLEADDLMGLNSGNGTIIVSDDKDLLTIAGYHYQPRKPEKGVFHIDYMEADEIFYTQILTGDRADGYTGIPGVGPKKAAKIFEANGVCWRAILKAYEDYGLTSEDALITARLARILRPGEFNWTENQPILWTPQ